MVNLTIDGAVRLGEQLIREGLITPEQLAEALAQQQAKGGRIGGALVEVGAITTTTLVQALSTRLGIKGCVLRHGLIDPKAAKCIPKEEAERLRVLPLFRVRDVLTVAMVEPQSLPAHDRLHNLTGCSIRPVLVLEDNLQEFQRKYLESEVSVDSFLASMEESEIHISETEAIDEGPATDIDQMVDGSPVVNLVNLAILNALRSGASDIHIEPDRDATHIRCRIDGHLREMLKPPKGMHAAIVSRVKVIGRMDIAEKRLPQEGRVHILADAHEVDLRVSTMPTVLGEKVVLRILDKSQLSFELGALGIRGQDRTAVELMIKNPYGLMLVTGPTGSGKTTTLYSALDLLRNEATNIVTIEDPVEYQLPLINQVQVNDSVGLTFVRTLRSLLRQDPDVIMVGEIRDQETARVAIQAALTGHLVLSTLHTNDCPGAVMRLIDMGIEPFLLSASLLGFIAQRLARKICPSCKTSYYPTADLLKSVGWEHRTNELFQKGEGCRQCNQTGFRGRSGIYEVMVMDAELKRMVQSKVTEAAIRSYLAECGWRSLRDKALDLVDGGESTLEEVLRVTRSEAIQVGDPTGAGTQVP
ncbi:MAG: Flp pilus assembly complex ATPase component TadA [Phycisphaerales bacterium]|nr:MAG: Flp pilus assembly complex ATPase component TadA [Phycisphaerales bacterium]